MSSYLFPHVKKCEILCVIYNGIAVYVNWQVNFIVLIENMLDNKIVMLLNDLYVITYNN